jgi:pimeloyl-ACP methyl ester carboxylesterase
VACGAAGELTVNGLRLRTHAWPGPGRPRAILLHSLAAHGHWWDWAAPRLAERFDVMALDFRGHGGSAHAPAGAYGFADYAADLIAVVDALGGAPPVIIGHSMGGYVAAWLAAHHPSRVAGAVIVDILTTWPEAFAQFARRQAGRPPAEFADPVAAGERFRLAPPDTTASPERVRHLGQTGVVERGGGWTHAFDRAVFLHPPVDPWPFLPRIACPALVVHGEHSTVMDAETCRRVAAAVPGGRAMTVPGAHHHLIVEEPERFSRMVGDWHRAIIAA